VTQKTTAAIIPSATGICQLSLLDPEAEFGTACGREGFFDLGFGLAIGSILEGTPVKSEPVTATKAIPS
jgi:hypothetical protein